MHETEGVEELTGKGWRAAGDAGIAEMEVTGNADYILQRPWC